MSDFEYTLVVAEVASQDSAVLIERARKYDFFLHAQMLRDDLLLLMFDRLNAAAVFCTAYLAEDASSNGTRLVVGRGSVDLEQRLPGPFFVRGDLVDELSEVATIAASNSVVVQERHVDDLCESAFAVVGGSPTGAVVRVIRAPLVDSIIHGRIEGEGRADALFSVVKVLMGTEYELRPSISKVLRRCLSLGLRLPEVWCNLASHYLNRFQTGGRLKPRLLRSAEIALAKAQVAAENSLHCADSTRAAILSNLANLEFIKGRVREAVDLEYRAVELDPENYRIHSNLAAFLMEVPDPVEARKHLLRALEREPLNYHTRFNFGVLMVRCGDPKSAILHMEYCSNLRPEDAYSHFWTAICAAKLQDYDKCFEHSSEAYRLHESDDTIAHLHAYALAKTERSDAAFELLRKLMEKKPEEIVLYVTEAYFHLWRADFLNAKKSYLRAIAKRQDDSIYNGLATASLALGEFDEALRYLSRARQKWPENNIIASNLEALTRLRKRPKEEQDKAISDLRSQLQRIPGFTALSVEYSMAPPAYDMILRTGGLRAYVSR